MNDRLARSLQLRDHRSSQHNIEWPTVVVAITCYAAFFFSTVVLPQFSAVIAVVVLSIALALHSSLQHEVVHGHPFKSRRLSEVLVFPAIGLFIPFRRFRETHLAHHRNPNLTDPYDDPESNYMDPDVWRRLPWAFQTVLRFNNTLMGRMLAGPAIGLVIFYKGDLTEMRRGNKSVWYAYVLHAMALIPVIWWVMAISELPAYLYFVAAYLGLSLLKIRTFLEHQAHERYRGRTVIIEDKGPLSFLFLNNNLHVVHHAHPEAPWYSLPTLFRNRRDHFLCQNFGYWYASYLDVFKEHWLSAKDPVPHPRPTGGEHRN